MRLRPSHVLLASIALAGCEKPARVELDPPSLRFSARGQTAKVHATPYDQRGKPLPDLVCKWSSTDDHVATAAGPHNEATVTAAGPGAAGVRCAVEGLVAEARVAVRLVSRIAVDPARLDLQVKDTPEPFALRVDAFDDAGGLVAGKTAAVRCENEAVCRGDQRGQVWPVGGGDTRAVVEVDGARGEVPVHVADARSAALKPRSVRGDPMAEYEKLVLDREKAEKAAAAKTK